MTVGSARVSWPFGFYVRVEIPVRGQSVGMDTTQVEGCRDHRLSVFAACSPCCTMTIETLNFYWLVRRPFKYMRQTKSPKIERQEKATGQAEGLQKQCRAASNYHFHSPTGQH